jgi:hypothetical protein
MDVKGNNSSNLNLRFWGIDSVIDSAVTTWVAVCIENNTCYYYDNNAYDAYPLFCNGWYMVVEYPYLHTRVYEIKDVMKWIRRREINDYNIHMYDGYGEHYDFSVFVRRVTNDEEIDLLLEERGRKAA